MKPVVEQLVGALRQQHGCHLAVDEQGLVIDAPQGVLDDHLRHQIRAHKDDIVALITNERTGIHGRYIAQNPARQPVVDILWPIECVDPDVARDLADAWMERVAICEIDGNLEPDIAEAIALDELRRAAAELN